MGQRTPNVTEALPPAVLICEADEMERQRISHLLSRNYQVTLTAKISEALSQVQRGAFSLLLLAFEKARNAQELNVIQVISIMHKIDPDLKIIIMAAQSGDTEDDSLVLEREIRSSGIFYYMLKPVEEGELKKVIGEAVRSPKKPGITR